MRPESGRTILFFFDDWHMSADSTLRSRAALVRLVDTVLGPNDRAAIFSASNQIGFLQQISDNKTVLRRAVARLSFTNATVQDVARPAMNEAQALAIETKDPDIFDFFVTQTMAAEAIADRRLAEDVVRHRAAALAQTSAEITARTLVALRRIISSCAALPGRKLVFLLSDGFVLQFQRDDVTARIRQVTDAAARAGIVIYTLDTRGLMVGFPGADASVPTPLATGSGSEAALKLAARLDRGYSEVLAYQDGLNALAADTGGRFIRNTNAFDTAIAESIEEASRYYLLGWNVDPDGLKPGHYSTIRVAVKDRPDLKVVLRTGSIDLSRLLAEEKNRTGDVAIKSKAGKELSRALDYPWPIKDLPTFLYAGYMYLPDRKEHVIDISMQVDIAGAIAGPAKTGETDRIDVLGCLANREGAIVASFEISPAQPAHPSNPPKLENNRFTYSRFISIDPGIYQVRVAAWNPKTGQAGSAHQWIEVPQIVPGRVLLGSIFLTDQQFQDPPRLQLPLRSFDVQQVSRKRSFASGSQLSYVVQVFNPADLPIQCRAAIYLGNQIVLQSPSRAMQAADPAVTEPTLLADIIPLEGLAAGSYVLEVSAMDTAGKVIVTQQVAFWIQ